MAAQPLPHSSGRTWATLLHVSGLVGFVLSPLGVILPLVIWGALRGRDTDIDLQGRLALNFQLSMLLYLIVGGLLLLLMSGLVIIVFVVAAEFYCTTAAAVHAARGEVYDYPLSLRFIASEPHGGGLHAA